MSTEKWSTQFQGFAELLFEELKPDLTLLLMELGRKKPEAIAQAEALLKQQLAEAAYDFAEYVLTFGVEHVNEVPDMVAWPLRKEQA